jgi:hypothetical protein
LNRYHVKRWIWLLAVLLGLLCIGGVGCKKKADAGTAKTPEEAAFQLRLSLQKASPQLQNLYNDKVDYGVRYNRYQEALTALEQMSADPSLKEEQKKLITQLSDILKAKSATP